jgi:putative SOS response-associated peptidase YedK
MCGRFVLYNTRPATPGFEPFKYGPDTGPYPFESLEPSYNIAPTMKILVARYVPEPGEPRMAIMRWGLVPSWAKDIKIGAKMINARAESVAEKPSFRSAFRRRRCLVIADGFYEWKRAVKPSQPYYFSMKDGHPFGIAGLWEQWKDPSGKLVESCAMITTGPNNLMRPVHDRMPVILSPKTYQYWCNPANDNPKKLLSLLKPFPGSHMQCWPVSTAVNIPKSNDKHCIDRLAP